jgi:hypothetical protein
MRIALRTNWRLMLLLAIPLLLPVGLQPQMPPQPAKLSVYSEPAGAIVTINGQQMQQRTNATFVVSPGRYQVSVINSNPRLNCPSKPVELPPGQTLVITCTATGWK